MSDKQSQEKIDILRAVGAQKSMCVPQRSRPDHPDSYYSVAERLNKEIPNSVWCNQYDNLANRQAHYDTTGPEIWKQTGGTDHPLLHRRGHGRNHQRHGEVPEGEEPRHPDLGRGLLRVGIQEVPRDGGVRREGDLSLTSPRASARTSCPPTWTSTSSTSLKRSRTRTALMTTRELAKKEGLFLGYSCGSAFQGLAPTQG